MMIKRNGNVVCPKMRIRTRFVSRFRQVQTTANSAVLAVTAATTTDTAVDDATVDGFRNSKCTFTLNSFFK